MEKVLIIAEAGVNYNGDIELAKKMVQAAAQAGADIVKFQTGKPENSISRYAAKADYQVETTGNDESQLEMCRKLMLPEQVYPELIEECKKNQIQFLSTPFDTESVDFLEQLGMRLWKIPSGEITNLPLLLRVAKTGDPVILSSGMCTLEEIKRTIAVLQKNGAGDITVLHCNTEYPTPFCDANLSAINTLRTQLQLSVGYSDHTMGFEAPVAATALGAVIIEKHFTLDRTMDGPDQKASIEPLELKQMVQEIRNIERAMGDGIKTPSPSEQKNIVIARKSIVARRQIKQGEALSEDNMTTKRPGDGISPMKWFDIIGTKAVRDFMEDEQIEL